MDFTNAADASYVGDAVADPIAIETADAIAVGTEVSKVKSLNAARDGRAHRFEVLLLPLVVAYWNLLV